MKLTLSALRAAYGSGALTPGDVVAEALRRADRHAAHNVWITRLTRDQLQPYLDRLAAHTPDSLPLYGVPFAIKDNIDLAGVPTTAACPAFRYTPARSAFVVQRLIDAGAIPLGKTNMDQFATGLVGTRSPYGACRNAFNSDYISGGSSSGSAVAVALGLAAFSLGTDTAGSGRVPAAFNNIVGVKPSKGLLSMEGVVRACRSLDCVSIFALTTDDANAVLEQAAVHDPDDDYARRNPFDNGGRHYGLPDGGFRFGVPLPAQLEFFGDASAQALFHRSTEKLAALGGERVEVDCAPLFDAARLLYEGPWIAERYVAIQDIVDRRAGELLPVIRAIIGGGRDKTAADAFKSEYRMQHYRRRAQALLASLDFLVTPTAATIYTVAEVEADPIRLNSRLGHYTNYLNLLDGAAVAVPAGFLDNGLPWGISFVAGAMRDRKLLSFANRWQQAQGPSLGALGQTVEPSAGGRVTHHGDAIPLVVCGAHLDGLALNWQLTERGAVMVERTTTAAHYRLYALPGDPPRRPGLVRADHGATVDVEVWAIPKAQLGSFIADVPAPLAIGKIELADGRWLTGFLCESYATEHGQDITDLGGWRVFLARQEH